MGRRERNRNQPRLNTSPEGSSEAGRGRIPTWVPCWIRQASWGLGTGTLMAWLAPADSGQQGAGHGATLGSRSVFSAPALQPLPILAPKSLLAWRVSPRMSDHRDSCRACMFPPLPQTERAGQRGGSGRMIRVGHPPIKVTNWHPLGVALPPSLPDPTNPGCPTRCLGTLAYFVCPNYREPKDIQNCFIFHDFGYFCTQLVRPGHSEG